MFVRSAFAYLGFKVDPEGQGEADRWRVTNFDAAAFRKALERVRGLGPTVALAPASALAQPQILIHLPNPGRVSSGGSSSGDSSHSGTSYAPPHAPRDEPGGAPLQQQPTLPPTLRVPTECQAQGLTEGQTARQSERPPDQTERPSGGVIFDPRWLKMRAAAFAAAGTDVSDAGAVMGTGAVSAVGGAAAVAPSVTSSRVPEPPRPVQPAPGALQHVTHAASQRVDQGQGGGQSKSPVCVEQPVAGGCGHRTLPTGAAPTNGATNGAASCAAVGVLGSMPATAAGGGGSGLEEAAGRLGGMLRVEEQSVERQIALGEGELQRAQAQLRSAQAAADELMMRHES